MNFKLCALVAFVIPYSVNCMANGTEEIKTTLLNSRIDIGAEATFIASAIGYKASGSYAYKGLLDGYIPFLEKEYFGGGVSYAAYKKDTNSQAGIFAIFTQLNLEESIKPFVFDLPIYSVLKLGISKLHIKTDSDYGGYGLHFVPEAHAGIPTYNAFVKASFFASYAMHIGGTSFFTPSLGLDLSTTF